MDQSDYIDNLKQRNELYHESLEETGLMIKVLSKTIEDQAEEKNWVSLHIIITAFLLGNVLEDKVVI